MGSYSDMKPLVLWCLPNADGHLYPALQVTEQLVLRGFDVTMVAAAKWEPSASKIGAHFAPLVGLWAREDFRDSIMDKTVTQKTRLKALRQSIGDTFVSMMFSGYQSLVLALVGLRTRLSAEGGGGGLKGRRVLILSDMCFTGTLPFRLGADLFPDVEIKTMCIGLMPRAWATPETPCWGAGLPWDPSEQGLRRNTVGNRLGFDEVQHRRLEDALFMCGCTRSLDSLLDEHDRANPLPDEYGFRRSLGNITYFAHDASLQMCIPSVEYPAANLPRHFKFGGQLPPKAIPSNLQYPEWWSEVLENSSSSRKVAEATGRKKIVFVAQGTESPDLGDLVMPTIHGLAGRDDVLVVACLCKRGMKLAGDAQELPRNVRVVDFFPYDAVLSHADVFVSSSGYGGLNHAIVNGVPTVQTGILIDKPDVGRRIEFAGMGVYISEFPPTEAMVAKAVETILSDNKYKKRVRELQAEAETYDAFGIIEREIIRLSG